MQNVRPPKTAKGSRRDVEVCCAAWLDLLGYGAMLEAARFDPTHADARTAVVRMREFHGVAAGHANRYLPIFTMNDGVVAFRDMSPRTVSVTYDFLRRSLLLFEAVNAVERAKGHPGARMVVATGFRIRTDRTAADIVRSPRALSIFTRLEAGIISAVQAVSEALRARPYQGVLPELEANFAFTKAYLAESSGRAAGFAGANCYIDLSMLSSPPPSWLVLAEPFEFSARGIHATFARYIGLDTQLAGKMKQRGALDAFDIAKRISTSDEIIQEMYRRRIRVYQ